MADLSMIQGALSSLKAAGEIIKILYDSKLSSDMQEKVMALNKLVFEARESALNAQEELSLIKAQMAEIASQAVELEQWEKESSRYKLCQPANARSVVYGLKEGDANGEPPHYLCTSCYQNRRKSILNGGKDGRQWQSTLICPVCQSEHLSVDRQMISPEFVTS